MRAFLAALLVFGVLGTGGLARADEIYGTLVRNGQPLRGARIEIQCGEGREPYVGQTDERGSYGIYVRRSGSCTFTLVMPGNPSTRITSYDDPAKYDFELLGNELRRR